MGDVRFDKPYEQLKEAMRPAEMLRAMSSEDVIAALAAASRHRDPFIANVLATEAQNRVGREATAMSKLAHGVYVVDATAKVVYVNEAAAVILGRRPADIVGQLARETIQLTDPTLSDNPGHGPEEVALATRGRVESDHGVLAARNGSPLFVAYSAVPLNRDGVITGAVVGFRDITKKREAELALARSEARHRALLDAIPDVILVIDERGDVKYANPAAETLFGKRATLVGSSLGIPSQTQDDEVVDVSTTGGSWRRARLRTIKSSWENEPAFLTIYSQVHSEPRRKARGNE